MRKYNEGYSAIQDKSSIRMKYLKTYKIFESNVIIDDRIQVIKDFIVELSDEGFFSEYEVIQNGTRIIVSIAKSENALPSKNDYLGEKRQTFKWSDIKDDIIKLITIFQLKAPGTVNG